MVARRIGCCPWAISGILYGGSDSHPLKNEAGFVTKSTPKGSIRLKMDT